MAKYTESYKKQIIREYILSNKSMREFAYKKGLWRETVIEWNRKYADEIYEEIARRNRRNPTWHNIDGLNGYYA